MYVGYFIKSSYIMVEEYGKVLEEIGLGFFQRGVGVVTLHIRARLHIHQLIQQVSLSSPKARVRR